MYRTNNSKYDIFNLEKIETYSIANRINRTNVKDLIDPSKIIYKDFDVPKKIKKSVNVIRSMDGNAVNF